MTDRATLTRIAAQSLRDFASQIGQTPVMVGFDGMVDTILQVVDSRQDADHYEPVETIERLAAKIAAAAGQSSNYELVTVQEKLGGNGPIMANALIQIGLPVTYIGGIGYPEVHPVYRDMAHDCELCLPVADPGYTDALEFRDGKLMLGKHANTRLVNRERIAEIIGEQRMQHIVRRSHLVAMVNWTMLLHTTDIWRYMLDAIFPLAMQGAEVSDTHLFIDLTDPEKRTRADLREALTLISAMQRFGQVALGLNHKEALQVAEVLEINACSDETDDALIALARDIRAALHVSNVVVHPRRCAAGARLLADGQVETAIFHGPFVRAPRLSTGAGDNFNAGYCTALLAGLPLEACLCVGTAASGYYVRNAASATLEQLADFCDVLPAPQ